MFDKFNQLPLSEGRKGGSGLSEIMQVDLLTARVRCFDGDISLAIRRCASCTYEEQLTVNAIKILITVFYRRPLGLDLSRCQFELSTP